MRASLGQRGRLAGGLLSYIAAPVLAGTSMNLLGNQFDEDVTLRYVIPERLRTHYVSLGST